MKTNEALWLFNSIGIDDHYPFAESLTAEQIREKVQQLGAPGIQLMCKEMASGE